MRNIPFWIDSAPIKRFPRLEKNLSVDVVVVGAGITGITAAWNYFRENKDYPYYMIKDRLTRPEADSVRELGRGAGMVIGSRGKKVAAVRDDYGKPHKLSPVCPHLGCHVRWNSAVSTWDCPCHGSRFKPTGEVIAGPAEEALSAL